MTKAKYMALADFQQLWSEEIEPAIQNSMLPELATEEDVRSIVHRES
jgi:hypothetical protein